MQQGETKLLSLTWKKGEDILSQSKSRNRKENPQERESLVPLPESTIHWCRRPLWLVRYCTVMFVKSKNVGRNINLTM